MDTEMDNSHWRKMDNGHCREKWKIDKRDRNGKLTLQTEMNNCRQKLDYCRQKWTIDMG